MARNKKQFSEKYFSPFASALRELMEVRGKTQADIARVVSKTPQTVSQYVNGVSEPGYDTLVKIADYFDVSLDYLLRNNGEPLKDPDVQSVHKYTGLSGASINILHSFIGDSLQASFIKRLFDDLLVEHQIVENVTYYIKKAIKAREMGRYERKRTEDSNVDDMLLFENGRFTISANEAAEMFLNYAIGEAEGGIAQVITEMCSDMSSVRFEAQTNDGQIEHELDSFRWETYSDEADEAFDPSVFNEFG